jgi:hypothetical protein
MASTKKKATAKKAAVKKAAVVKVTKAAVAAEPPGLPTGKWTGILEELGGDPSRIAAAVERSKAITALKPDGDHSAQRDALAREIDQVLSTVDLGHLKNGLLEELLA